MTVMMTMTTGNSDDGSRSRPPSHAPSLTDDATNHSFSLSNNGHGNVAYDPGGDFDDSTRNTDDNGYGNGDDSSRSHFPLHAPPISDDAANDSFSLSNDDDSNLATTLAATLAT
jgi:hypothetical protein